jgi:hypothetical protein
MGASLTRELFVVECVNAPAPSVPVSSAAKYIPALLPEATGSASAATSIYTDITAPVSEPADDLPDSPQDTPIADDLSEHVSDVPEDAVTLKNTGISPLFTGVVVGLIAAFPFFAVMVAMTFLRPTK